MDNARNEKECLRKPSYDRVTWSVAITIVIMVVCAVFIGAYERAYGENNEYHLMGSAPEYVEIYDNPYVANGLTVIGERIELLEFTSSVAQGEYATVRIQGDPYEKYSITVYLKSGPSQNAALVEKEADQYGVVEWYWKISSKTSVGDVRVVIQRMDRANNCITYAEAVMVVTKKSE